MCVEWQSEVVVHRPESVSHHSFERSWEGLFPGTGEEGAPGVKPWIQEEDFALIVEHWNNSFLIRMLEWKGSGSKSGRLVS